MNVRHGRGILGMVAAAILSVAVASACPDTAQSGANAKSNAAATECATSQTDSARTGLARTLEASGYNSEEARTTVGQLADEDVRVLTENPAMIQPGGNENETSAKDTTGQTRSKGDDSQATSAPNNSQPPQQEDRVSTNTLLIICGAVVVAVCLIVIVA